MKILTKTWFAGLKRARELGSQETLHIVKDSGLSGRGGANFSTGSKWEFAMANPKPRCLICNADEGEPGTFKDKFILENNPELLIEGVLIASFVLETDNNNYIYLRGEYAYLKNKLLKTIKKLKADKKIKIILGAGAYVCGEETAIIRSIAGFRGEPYTRPPYPASKGLFDMPTVINNVETLANIPLVLTDKNWNKDLRLFCLSGNVSKPGVYEMPLGTRLSDLVELGKPNKKPKAVYFGAFGGMIPYSDTSMDYKSISEKGAMLGSCTIIVVDETKSIVDTATIIAKFFEYESCGKCTPCREGNMRVLELLEKISEKKALKKDLELLKELAEMIKEVSLCGLGQSSTNHVLTALKYFGNEFEERCK